MRKGLNVGGAFWKETQKVGAKKQEEEAGKEEKNAALVLILLWTPRVHFHGRLSRIRECATEM